MVDGSARQVMRTSSCDGCTVSQMRGRFREYSAQGASANRINNIRQYVILILYYIILDYIILCYITLETGRGRAAMERSHYRADSPPPFPFATSWALALASPGHAEQPFEQPEHAL